MFYPSQAEFVKLSKQGNLIPVYTEIAADLETPVSAFLKIETKDSFLLESVEQGENIARYSFIGSKPFLKYKAGAKADAYVELKKILAKYKPVKVAGLPNFHGGAVGYFSYDTVRQIENIPDQNPDELKIPLAQFMLTDTILAFDHVKHKIFVIANAHVGSSPSASYRKAVTSIKNILAKLRKPLPAAKYPIGSTAAAAKLSSNFSEEEFKKIVEQAKEYILAGDIIQVVLSQRFTKKFGGNSFDLYRKLRMVNPSPYMFYLKFDDLQVVGASPEVLVKYIDGVASVRPIAGTRPRGQTPEEDQKLEQELLADEKERAEHLMLLDLGRNDLGRVCDFRTVKVTESYIIERYSHVMHIVSNVEGQLKKGSDRFDLLRATFPAGTVSGAPKVRAMEIIDELENRRRGLYAGAVGYFDFYGNLDFCIAIRTMLVKNQQVYIQSGAGIVADSDPAKEYQETFNKARAMLKVFE